MKVTDLMIGDWFHNNYVDKNFQVWRTFFSQATNYGKRLDATFEDVNIAPIPLTKEILEKNGWVNGDCPDSDSEDNFFFPEDKEHSLELHEGVGGVIQWQINTGEYVIMDILYVHQLQHALKLCGVEKEIEL